MSARKASGRAFLIQGSKMEGALNRLILSDDQWERAALHLPGKVGDPGRSGADNRTFLEAVLWVARVGGPWRDLR
jgi:transposase